MPNATFTLTLPKRTGTPAKSDSASFNSNNVGKAIAALATTSHLRDLYADRVGKSDEDLIQELMSVDPDVSAAVNAYLTVANTRMNYLVKDANGLIDRKGQQLLDQIIYKLTTVTDYSVGYSHSKSIAAKNRALRYMLLLRGSIAVEMGFSKDDAVSPSEVRVIDTKSLEWYENESGRLVPKQKRTSGDPIDMNIPTFFYSDLRRDPTTPYTKSPFISAINTIFSRQQVVNDLYRLMQITGYPRMDVTVLEESILNSLPIHIQNDMEARDKEVAKVIATVTDALRSIRPDQPFIHTDSVDVSMVNESKAAMSMDISPVIEVLNAQNQASLKVMATILGRGQSGVNTASIEARLFALIAQEVNEPLDDVWSQYLTLAIRLQGSTSTVHCQHEGVDLRPEDELEPSRLNRQARLLRDLSLGIIDDDTYHLKMYDKIRPDTAPILQGTGFYDASKSAAPIENKQGTNQPSSAERQSKTKADKTANSSAVKK